MPLLDASLRTAAFALIFVALLLLVLTQGYTEGMCPSGGIRDDQGNCLPEIDPAKRGVHNFGGGMSTPYFVMVGPRLL
jgi:hypothetical protein